jgi:UDP-GlcNAc:undecaprenyl-phosphate GlcNAc-1-phosphate transferase
MNPLLADVLILILAFLINLKGTQVAQKAALHFGIVDKPDGKLKVHQGPIPYLGGLSIFISFLISLSIIVEFDQRVLGLLLGGTLVMLLGLLDDLRAIEPIIKILGELLAVVVLIKSGIVIDIIFLTDFENVVLTVFWVLTLTNAFNIIDIMDGLSGGVSAISILFMVIITYINGQYFISVLAAALLGAVLGFLKYNFVPAKIYLGDSGSLFLGFMLASLSMIASYSQSNRLALLSPLVLFAVPLFDLSYVVVMRLLKKKSPFRGSKDHYAVRMRIYGISVKKIVLFSYALSFVLGAATLFNTFLSPIYSLILYAVIIIFFVGFGVILSRIKVD